MKLEVKRGKQQRCPYCHDGFEDEAILTCRRCETRYHLDCAERCIILGCHGQLVEDEARDVIRVRPSGTRGPRLVERELARVDVSGRDGLAGSRGSNGQEGSRSGADGTRGQDALPATDGQNGGRLSLWLEQPAPGELRVRGEGVTSEGERVAIDRRVAIGEAGVVRLVARGGAGGSGGRGGDGGAGARGRRGTDATRYSSGGRGGPGGDGGRGGDGTPGGDGGWGGLIEVNVAPADTHLLLLVETDVSGGEAGAAGENGRGGVGGRGGSGGNSHSWTEQESYTDANGTRQTRTRFRSNSGGSPGRSGRPGQPGGARVAAGEVGLQGEVRFLVGEEVYATPFDLRLEGLSHENANEDGVYEPGERVQVRGLEVLNTGGMPLPQAPVEVRLLPGEWVEPLGAPLRVPAGLASLERTELRGALEFRIGDYRAEDPSGPLGESCRFELEARVPAAGRAFTSFGDDLADAAFRFRVSFPGELHHLESPPSLGPEEVMRVSVDVRNVSSRSLGSMRGLALRLFLADEDSRQSAFLCDLEGGFGRAGTVRLELPRLAPGESTRQSVLLAIRGGAPARRELRLRAALELGYPDEPERMRDVQLVECGVRVATRFRPPEDADLLLVVNHTTSREATDVLRRAAIRAGYVPALWDLSLEGHLRLEDEGLLARFRGGAIVLLDDVIDTGPESRAQAFVFLDDDDLRLALEQGTGVAILGPGTNLERLIVPPRELAHPIVADLAAYVASSSWAWARQPVEVRCWSFSTPSEEWLEERARALQSRLRAEHPHRRFLVVTDYALEPLSEGLLRSRYRLGHLEVRELTDGASSPLSRRSVDELLPASIADLELDFLLLRPFAKTLERFGAWLAVQSERPARDAPSPPLADVLAGELALEQEQIAHVGWRRGLSRERAEQVAPRLAALREAFPAWVADAHPESPRARAAIELLARIRWYASAQVRWWEWIPPFVWLRRLVTIRSATRRAVNDALCEGFQDPEALELAETVLEDAERELDGEHERSPSAPLRQFARKRLLQPFAGRTTSAEVLSSDAQRILSARALAGRRRELEAEAERRQELEQAGAARRLQALHTETASELLARANPTLADA